MPLKLGCLIVENDIGLLVFEDYIIKKKDPFWKIAT